MLLEETWSEGVKENATSYLQHIYGYEAIGRNIGIFVFNEWNFSLRQNYLVVEIVIL